MVQVKPSSESQHVDKLWNKNFIILLGANIFIYMAFYLVITLLSKYAISLGASLSMAGMIVGLFAIIVLFIGPFGGLLTDRTNKKYVMIIGTLINGIATLGYSFAPNIGILIFFRVLHGVGFSVTTASGLAWATDFIPKNKMGEGIGYLGISQIIATAFGPEIGIEAASGIGISKTFIIAAVLPIIASIFMSFISNENQACKKNSADKKNKINFRAIIATEILPLSLIGGLFSLGNGLVASFLVLLGEQRNIKGVGIYFIVNALLLVFTRPLSGKLYDRRGLSIILYPALLFSTMESLLLGHANALWMIILAAAVKAFGQGTAQPALQAECLRKLGSQRRGVASSTYFLGASIGQGFGPLIGGSIASVFGYAGMFNFSAVMMLCGILGYTIYNKKRAVLHV
ncbi:arabinose efflux permease family protein [Desulfosporosinus orientis DSM 765]|uniref:Arabinose efflux permease family protein n=1 Tax=Desulfosporosinus orientis (strain ATCC 19365 / DSM 765 / NCIMB 8382 / VKM B-1628 / Singapore I) TaxID=768706 RepID=G7W6D1_DESOD|nr:MFS transporter [Desulfosporosinus orientis]AET68138.1 arabinose efflux permease family protein [Desulfosporosinus orientis DSM 765]